MMYSRFPSLVSTLFILPTEKQCHGFITGQLGISIYSDAYYLIVELVRQYRDCDKQLESAYNYHQKFGTLDGFTLFQDVTELSVKKQKCFRKIRQIRKEYARKLSDEEISDIAHSRLRSLFEASVLAPQ